MDFVDYKPTFQVASNLYLDFFNIAKNIDYTKLIKPSADILLLAGNIGNPRSELYLNFINWCSLRFKYVFFVSGPHEYFSLPENVEIQKVGKTVTITKIPYKPKFTIEETNEYITELTKIFKNVHFLNFNGCFKLFSVCIIGGNVVSEGNNGDPLNKKLIKGCKKLHLEEIEKGQKEWIKDQVHILRQENPNRKILLVTFSQHKELDEIVDYSVHAEINPRGYHTQVNKNYMVDYRLKIF